MTRAERKQEAEDDAKWPAHVAGEIIGKATTKLALLIRFAEAEGRSERHGKNQELDREAWYQIETMLQDIRHDIQRVPGLFPKGGV